jgi:Glycosyltransferases involved in cell wall biogenesis
MNKISIIIPIYNVEKYLIRCLDSILRQTYRNIQVILVNDGSTDHSPKIVEEYALKDKRVKFIHQVNGGLSDARNTGYQFVTGDYLMFVDSDDLVATNFCEKMLQKAHEFDADIVECDFIRFKNEDELLNLHFDSTAELMDSEIAIERLMKNELKQVVWNKLYRTSVVNNLFFERGRIHEDEFWTYQILGNAKKILKISDKLYFYRQQNQSIMAEKYSIKRLDGMFAREQRMFYVLKNFPKLSVLAVQTFWHSAFNNYQAIVRHEEIDPDSKIRKAIVEKVRENVSEKHYQYWRKKDIVWLKFFLFAPKTCSRLRNFVGVGV